MRPSNEHALSTPTVQRAGPRSTAVRSVPSGKGRLHGRRDRTRSIRVVEGFFQRPKGWTFVEVADVGVDRDDNVYRVLSRQAPGDDLRQGRPLPRRLGRDSASTTSPSPTGSASAATASSTRPTAATTPSASGRRTASHVLTLGSAHQNAPAFSGKPFNRPTHATVAPNGDIYVSDGYGNAKIHCFSPDGEPKFSWGAPGKRPGRVQHGPQRVHRPGRRHAVRRRPLQQPGPVVHAWTASTSASGAACVCRRACARARTGPSTSPSCRTA